ncbi:uncharacterized protein LOC109810814 [Cajanus cajan]|uniref:uncharacterized protein LOC109810814 n=1 Tax=Cajanus cajan TaxID=3821 RepID=UPI00098DD031|nr:uncharacterized protein LOC109810814 [Cajanus cajan]
MVSEQENETVKTDTLKKTHTSASITMQSITPLSPYYLGASDNPGTPLVTVLLTGDNYRNWARSMKTTMRAKTKLGFIDDELAKLQPLPECTCGASKELAQQEEEQRVHLFLGGIDNERYHHVKGTLLSDSKQEIVAAFHVANFNRCKGRDGPRPKCDHCGKIGHEKARCFELVDYPQNWESLKPKGKYPGGARLAWAGYNHDHAANMEGGTSNHAKKNDQLDHMSGNHLNYNNDRWVLDSRASHHMTPTYSILKDLRDLDEPLHIIIPTGDAVLVKKIGTVQLDQAMKRKIGSGDLCDGVYVLRMANQGSSLAAQPQDAIVLWHAIMGHPSNKFDKKVKVFRNDNGTEFTNTRIQSFFQDEGIVHQVSCVVRPQQNGRVEHKHRHILNVARALRFHVNLPLSFWGECVLTATHIINRTPTSTNGGLTPYEMLFGKTPLFDHLQVFGCLCYMKTPLKPDDKFATRAHKCIFVGYPTDQKEWRVYNLDTKKFSTSRDIIFYERIFPYAQGQLLHEMTVFPYNPATVSPLEDHPMCHMLISNEPCMSSSPFVQHEDNLMMTSSLVRHETDQIVTSPCQVITEALSPGQDESKNFHVNISRETHNSPSLTQLAPRNRKPPG